MTPRPELFSDVAGQFERLEQPLSLAWMQERNVPLEEVYALSQAIALVIRGYCALHPAAQIKFVTHGIIATLANPQNTILGERADSLPK